jgi:four helix bundle protein
LIGRTFNVQLPTFNFQRKKVPVIAKGDFDLEERLLDYSAAIIELVDALPTTRSANHVAGQLLRSGTSALPNHGEAQAAESRNDFVHKMRICLKELRESRRWLKLIHRSPRLTRPGAEPLVAETEELIRIFFTSIRTARTKSQRSKPPTKAADAPFGKIALKTSSST